MNRFEINIEKYIQDYEAKKIDVKEIGKLEDCSTSTVYKKIREYYREKGIQRPKLIKKQIEIEKYIQDYEDGIIATWQIAINEGTNESAVKKRLKEYYQEKGLEMPIKHLGRTKDVNIEKYIQDYEARKITAEEIAQKEKVSGTTIYRRLRDYYKKEKRKNPFSTDIKKQKDFINIEDYIEDYEKGLISISEIAAKEKVSYYTINNRLTEYYEKEGKPKLKVVSQTTKRGIKKKEIDIERYIKDYEERKISVEEIAQKENVQIQTIYSRINEYYNKKGITRSMRKQLKIETYIEDYENGNITIREIALKERVTTSTIKKRIDQYYQEKGIEKPDTYFMHRKKYIDIEKYIQDYEERKISAEEIAEKENVSNSTVYGRIKEYYIDNEIRKTQKFLGSSQTNERIPKNIETTIKEFLKRGLSKENIKEIAEKRNIIISDEIFEQLSKEINDEEVER